MSALALRKDVIRTPSTIGKVEGVWADCSPKISCDWFQGSMSETLFQNVVTILASEFGSPQEVMKIPREMRAYRSAYRFAGGVTLYTANRYYKTCCLVLSGSANPTQHLNLIARLVSLGVKPTRLDLAFDDRRSVLALEKVKSAILAKNAVTRWKLAGESNKFGIQSGEYTGSGMILGSKTSASYLSIYDKGLESGNAEATQWIRWELRLSDDEAEKFLNEFLDKNPYADSEDLAGHLKEIRKKRELLCYDKDDCPVFESNLPADLVLRFKELALEALKQRLSFRDRDTAKNTSRAKLLHWWEEFLEYFDPDDTERNEDSKVLASDGSQGGDEFFTNISSISDWPDEDDERTIRNRQRSRQESRVRNKASEILTEIYEEHLRPDQPDWMANISDYEEVEGDCNLCDDSPEDVLALVGLLPAKSATIISLRPHLVGKLSSGDTSKRKQAAVIIQLPLSRRRRGATKSQQRRE